MTVAGGATAFVVTPVLNRQELIAGTVRSVVQQTAVQSGRVRLRYTIADGGSTDGTVEHARRAGGAAIEVVSRPDAGIYDALAATWEGAAADPPTVMAYLNAGDLWHPHALDVVLDVMQNNRAEWVCGYQVVLNEQGQVTTVTLPFRFRPRLIGCGMYDGRLPHLQQETTFWSGRLMQTVDLDRLRTFRLAGDHYLWRSFASVAEPHIVEAMLGGFRVHPAPLSGDASAYLREQRQASSRPRLADRVLARSDRLIWEAPPWVKKRRNRDHLLRFDHRQGSWR